MCFNFTNQKTVRFKRFNMITYNFKHTDKWNGKKDSRNTPD